MAFFMVRMSFMGSPTCSRSNRSRTHLHRHGRTFRDVPCARSGRRRAASWPRCRFVAAGLPVQQQRCRLRVEVRSVRTLWLSCAYPHYRFRVSFEVFAQLHKVLDRTTVGPPLVLWLHRLVLVGLTVQVCDGSTKYRSTLTGQLAVELGQVCTSICPHLPAVGCVV